MKSVCIVIPSYKSKGKLSKVLEEIETISNELKSDFKIKKELMITYICILKIILFVWFLVMDQFTIIQQITILIFM